MTYYSNAGLQVTSSRKLFLVAAAVAVGASIALTAILKPASAVSELAVSPTNTQGWTTAFPADNRPGGSVSFTSVFGAPSGFGAGSLRLETATGSAKAQYMKVATEGTLLSSVNDLSYSTYRSSASTAPSTQVAAINVAVDINGSASGGFTTLVFEPVYQVSTQGPVLSDVWQDWDAGNNTTWWSSNPINVAPNRDTFVSLATIKQANPDAVVLYYGLNQGSGNAGLISGVDAFNFNGNVYNFEPDTTVCKNGGWQSEGFSNQGKCVSSVVANDNASFKRQ